MRPDDEDALWGEQKRKRQDHLASGTPSKGLLADRFPELMTAGGGVDPQEALVALLDRIAELEARVDEAGRNSSSS